MVASFVSDGHSVEAWGIPVKKKYADGFTPDPVLLSAIVSVFMDQSVCSKGDETHGHVLHIYGKIIVKMLNISKAHIF